MSANRALAASQRRRVLSGNDVRGGTSTVKTGPTPSINSAQAFSQQQQATGRLAGQHAAYNQQQQMKQQQQSKTEGKTRPLTQGDINKITVAQAIMLITLRLGKVEAIISQMNIDGIMSEIDNINEEGYEQGNTNMVMVDKELITNIVERLDALETSKVSQSETPSVSDANLKKINTQIDTLKNSLVKSNTATTRITKENAATANTITALKTDVITMKQDLKELREQLDKQEQQILEMSLNDTALGGELETNDEDVEETEDIENTEEYDNDTNVEYNTNVEISDDKSVMSSVVHESTSDILLDETQTDDLLSTHIESALNADA